MLTQDEINRDHSNNIGRIILSTSNYSFFLSTNRSVFVSGNNNSHNQLGLARLDNRTEAQIDAEREQYGTLFGSHG